MKAFDVLAGSNFGDCSNREICISLIELLVKEDTGGPLGPVLIPDHYMELAELFDDDENGMLDLIDRLIADIEYYCAVPVCCNVAWQRREVIIKPYVDEDLPRLEEVPDKFLEDVLYTVSDHGNVSCWQWVGSSYDYQWGMV